MQTGAPIFGTGLPLSVELGPGLIQSIYDGVQRPLPLIEEAMGSFISRGARFDPIDRKKRWKYTSRVKVGDEVKGGSILGVAMETETFEHRVMVHPDDKGTITWVAPDGEYTVTEPIAKLKVGKQEKELVMLQRWPVRRASSVCEAAGASYSVDYGTAYFGYILPRCQRWGGRHSGSVRFRQDRYTAQHRQMGGCAGDRVYRLRRTRQRDD